MLMKKIVLSLAAVGMISGVASVSAGELVNEFGGNVAIGTQRYESGGTSTSSTSSMGTIYGGHFFNPNVEMVGAFTVSASSNSKTYIYAIGGNYYFMPVGKAGNIAPYVGATVGGISFTGGGNSSNGSSYSAYLGMKYFVTDSAALDLKLHHQEYKFSITGADQKYKEDQIMLGASILF